MNQAIIGTVNSVTALLLLAIGVSCLLSARSVVKQLIGLTIMLQGAMLTILDAGRVQGHLRTAQGMVVSALVAEAIVLAIGLTFIVNIFTHYPEGRVDDLDLLRG